MTSFESWSLTISGLSLAVAILVMILIYRYVRKTAEMAANSSRHNEILTRPYVTVSVQSVVVGYTEPKIPLGGMALMEYPIYTRDHIQIVVVNHTKIHANVKITIDYHITEPLNQVQVNQGHWLAQRGYDGKSSWNIAAEDRFIGHTDLPELAKLGDRTDFEVTLRVDSQVAPFRGEANQYQENPSIKYTWKGPENGWVPDPLSD